MGTEAVVPVNLSTGKYDITIRRGLLSQLGAHFTQLSQSKKAAIVSDSNVGPRYVPVVVEALRQVGVETVIATLPAGEDHKTLTDLSTVYDVLLRARIERTTPILALGGGVIGDMAGFAAATILRG